MKQICDIRHIQVETVLDWLRKQVMAATNTVIVILDCCHAGAASVRGNPTVRPIADADIDRSMGT